MKLAMVLAIGLLLVGVGYWSGCTVQQVKQEKWRAQAEAASRDSLDRLNREAAAHAIRDSVLRSTADSTKAVAQAARDSLRLRTNQLRALRETTKQADSALAAAQTDRDTIQAQGALITALRQERDTTADLLKGALLQIQRDSLAYVALKRLEAHEREQTMKNAEDRVSAITKENKAIQVKLDKERSKNVTQSRGFLTVVAAAIVTCGLTTVC